MGDGTVKYPYYSNGGEWEFRGLKNKRRTYWAAVRRAKQMRIENAERAIAEWENDWEEQYGVGHGQY